MRRLAGLAAREPRGRRDPAGVAAHHLEHEHLGRGPSHGGHVERRLASGHRDVLGHRAESRAAVGMRQIVVDRLRHPDTGDGIAERLADLRDLQGRIHRVVAAVVEEVADVVSAKNLDQPLVLRAVLVDALQLEACRAEGSGRRMLESANGGRTFTTDVDQVLRQRADDAVTAGVHLPDIPRLPHGSLDDTAGGGVDDGRHTAGLGIERVLFGRRFFHGTQHIARPPV